jgi:hypothetical protein
MHVDLQVFVERRVELSGDIQPAHVAVIARALRTAVFVVVKSVADG